MNTKTNQLVVVHNNPYRNKLSFVDPETLEITDSRTIEHKIFSIAYNEKRGSYVAGLSGGQSFAILDNNFNKTSGPFTPTDYTTGYVTQGLASSNDFIFFALYIENIITVYDWDGNFVALIDLTLGGQSDTRF